MVRLLRPLTGSVDRALLLLPLLSVAALLALVYAALLRLSGGALLPALGGCLFVAAAPLFVALSTKFLVEPLQALAAAGFIHAAVFSMRWSRRDTLTAIVGWGCLTVLSKASSPIYCVVPGAVCAWNLFFAKGRAPATRAANLRLALAGLLLLLTLAWYRVNAHELFSYAQLAASGWVGELYGHRAPFADKLGTWLRILNKSMSRWNLWVLLLALGLGSLAWGRVKARRAPRSDLLGLAALLALAQVALVLTVVSLNVGEEPRYIFALGPSLGVIAAWALSRIEWRPVAVAAVALLALQFGVMQAIALGVRSGTGPWMIPLTTDRHRAETLRALVRETAPGAEGRACSSPSSCPGSTTPPIASRRASSRRRPA